MHLIHLVNLRLNLSEMEQLSNFQRLSNNHIFQFMFSPHITIIDYLNFIPTSLLGYGGFQMRYEVEMDARIMNHTIQNWKMAHRKGEFMMSCFLVGWLMNVECSCLVVGMMPTLWVVYLSTFSPVWHFIKCMTIWNILL